MDIEKAITRFDRIQLACLPTPLKEARNLSKALNGPRIFIKRDDLTGIACGGNKTRKLEYLMADVLSSGADCVITAGSVQSNHCLQTAASAARLQLDCHLVLCDPPSDGASGNHFFDQLFNAQIHWTDKKTRNLKMDELCKELTEKGKKPYVIPIGGSNWMGALGYVNALNEVLNQAENIGVSFDHIYYGTSSGGTQAGLEVGKRLLNWKGKLVGISVDQFPDSDENGRYKQFVLDIVEDLLGKLDSDLKLSLDDLSINYDYLGEGYGVLGENERKAIDLLANNEGYLVGPVYTGRVLGGLIDIIEKEHIKRGETVLFWHTGDTNALHAYKKEFL